MGTLSADLKNLGYEPTERDSPFHDDGELWTNSYEFVCDETGFIIRKEESKWQYKGNGIIEVKETFKFNDDEDDDNGS
jgi:hypothetical protein